MVIIEIEKKELDESWSPRLVIQEFILRRFTPLDQNHIEPHMCGLDLRLYILRQLPFFKSFSK